MAAPSALAALRALSEQQLHHIGVLGPPVSFAA
jgi:hypothetical protein